MKKLFLKPVTHMAHQISIIAMLLTYAMLTPQAFALDKEVSLKEFQTSPGPIKFFGASTMHDLYIPLYAHELIDSIELELYYTNSISLLPDISQLIVMADGFVVGQTGLRGATPGGKERFKIPVELLNSDTMRLSLIVNQHYDTDCENPSAGQLWTNINPVKSKIVFSWKGTPERTTLRHWVDTFSPSNPFLEKAVIVVPETSLKWIEAASSIASWLASLRSYRPLYLHVSTSIRGGIPNIIIGPISFLKRLIAETKEALERQEIDVRLPELPEISGPSAITFYMLDEAGVSSYCLAVTGPLSEDSEAAASRLAAIQQDWPETSLIALEKGVKKPGSFTRNCLVPEKKYTFKELGLFENMTFQGMGVTEKSISLHIPPEIYRQENRYARLHMDLIYSAGLREDSSLHISVNNTLAGSIGLNNPEGQAFSNYLINVPMSFFRPGHNTLSFKVIMKPYRAQKCAPIGQDSMVTAILNSSEISIPEGFEHYSLPDLALLMDDMFPFSLDAEEGRRIPLILDDLTNPDIFEAALNFAAIFAKKLGTPYNYLVPTNELPQGHRGSAIFISTLGKLDKNIRSAMPAFGPQNTLKYLLPGKREEALSVRNSISDSRFFMTEMEFPESSTATALIFTAENAATIKDGIRIIAGPEGTKIYGDTALIDTYAEKAKSYSLNRKYQIGRLGLQGPAGNWLTSRPEYYYPLLGAVVFVTVLAALYIIRRRKRMREEPLDE